MLPIDDLLTYFLLYRWVPNVRLNHKQGEMSSFVEGLGKGQTVGRQALASPFLGKRTRTRAFHYNESLVMTIVNR